MHRKSAVVIKKILCLIALTAGLAAVWVLVSGRSGSTSMEWQDDAPTYSDSTAELIFTEGATETALRVNTGESFAFPEAAPREYYTFLYWEDESGSRYPAGSRSVAGGNARYEAVYLYALNTSEHRAYLFPDKNGDYRAETVMTCSELTEALRCLLPEKLDAEQVLRELGVENEELDSDIALTRRRMQEILSGFYTNPTHLEEYFAGVSPESEHKMLRREAAQVLNLILGRQPEAERELSLLLGITEEENYFGDMAEAVVDHSFIYGEDGAECWTESAIPTHLGEGFLFVGGNMFYVDKQGNLVKNTVENNYQYDQNGVYTTGYEELDAAIDAILDEITDGDMTTREKLKAAYDYVVQNYSYLKGDFYDVGDSSWAAEAALPIVRIGKGNCYSFAGVYYVLCRAIGVNAQVVSGYIGKDHNRHGWVTVELDGEIYICDPETAWSYLYYDNEYHNMFLMDDWAAFGYTYSME